MTDYKKLVEALRRCANRDTICTTEDNCGYLGKGFFCTDALMTDAAAAIEALQAEVKRLNMRCADCEYAASEWPEDPEHTKMPKRGEIVRCGECAHCYAEGFAHERNICEKHPELGNVPDDWFCADGEREAEE